MGHADDSGPEPVDPGAFWERRYRERDKIWSGLPNAALVDTASSLAPGRALDLGCGEGADALWLASRGWDVTGVDISSTAIRRAGEEASRLGLTDRVRFLATDLSTWEPDGQPYDLITSAFLHSPVDIPRDAILHRAAAHVAIGGHLLTLTHAAPPPWFDATAHPGNRFITPTQEYDELALPNDEWSLVAAEMRPREATGPSGESARVIDGILLVRRG